ncbi:hypothetical protein H4S03_006574 [Coemansia sp. S3946]|nr:hypothetical protein H4S03_006574 [Coemansia sp. S3946]
MDYQAASYSNESRGDVEEGETLEPLFKLRLDEIRRDVRASKSTWADLRQKYPPGGSCFEPFNFTVSSWSAIAKEDARGLGDDLDTDEAFSQAAAMAAYGVDILSSALNGPTVDRELTVLANNLFSTLCATLMDTRDRHRDSVTKAVAEKIETFSNILNGLNSTPQTEDASSHMESVERDEQSTDSHELAGLLHAIGGIHIVEVAHVHLILGDHSRCVTLVQLGTIYLHYDRAILFKTFDYPPTTQPP